MTRSLKAAPGGKDKILDAAERLFAEAGYYGASLREITQAAGVEVGLAPYHFGSKDELYRQVLLRRAPELAADLEAALATVSPSLTRKQAIDAILRAYVDPQMAKLRIKDDGWRSYMRLAAQARLVLKSARLTDAAAPEFNPTIERFRKALHRALPKADPATIDRHFYIFQTSILGILLDLSSASKATEAWQREDGLAASIVDCFAAGFLAIGAY